MSIKKNAFINYAGQGWIALVGIVFVPIYLKHLGIANYGLIGIYTVLQTWVSLLDLGITPTITREMAKLQSGEHIPQSIRNLIFTFETLIYTISTCVLLILLLSSDLISDLWINSEDASNLPLVEAIQVASFVVASRFCEGIYRGGLIGLEKHYALNKVQVFFSTLKFGGAAILVSFHPSIVLFFTWQALVSICNVIYLRKIFYRYIPKGHAVPVIDFSAISKIKNFAGGMTITNLIALVFTQSDKFIVSFYCSLESFGAYMLAFTITGILPMLIYPIVATISPKLNVATSLKNESNELFLFNTGNQIATLIATPIFAVCFFFGYQVIFSWTNDPFVASISGNLLSMLVIGIYCNALMLIPFSLQQAHGWTTLSIASNLIGLLILIPTAYTAVNVYGATGVAFSWALSNLVILFIATIKMHQKLLCGELKPFFKRIILKPFLISSLVAIPINFYFSNLGQNRWLTFFGVLLYIFISALLILATLPIKNEMLKLIKNKNIGK